MNLAELSIKVRQFADERDWRKYHNPKNLVMAMSVEMAELVEHYQWLTPEEASHLEVDEQSPIAQEMADVMLYMLRLADELGVDIEDAILHKMTLNAQKYPVK
ncbi:nucleotide pyrophosphohydrolase [Chitinibacter bivalviorum]|uniref:Nucleotide pyrophosphohydrolase n=1 Tax=Chitinibacter bivalviorum TaxID=2739434 RepID=A0A7H9BFL4_9NEIS|nr:nucleotide pyrophosphohydrolase [Chitinibacter bivalviorum]QLG87365.1 nucleotide pyrophosphohydrolase [Chitinibacter bivalviorum]